VRRPKLSTQLTSSSEAHTLSSIPSDADGVKWRSHQWVSVQHFHLKMILFESCMMCQKSSKLLKSDCVVVIVTSLAGTVGGGGKCREEMRNSMPVLLLSIVSLCLHYRCQNC